LSDIEGNGERIRDFLRVVYSLANGTASTSVLGDDVAERLGLERKSQEFQNLARYHELAGNTQARDLHWGIVGITDKGVAEVESQR
jgi:hypothetical protein